MILIQNGHFCNPESQTLDFAEMENLSNTRNQSLMNPKYYQICVSNSQKQIGSILSTVTIAVISIPGFFYGIIVDRFRVLFVRCLVILFFIVGLFFMSQVSLQTEIYVFIAIFLISFGNALLMIEATRDVPQSVPQHENIVRSVCLGLQTGTGFFYSLINKYFIGREIRFQDPEYFWNIKNFSLVMIGLCLVIMVPRTLIWLKGKYGGQYEFKRENHRLNFNRYSVIDQEDCVENRSSIVQHYQNMTQKDGSDNVSRRSSIRESIKTAGRVIRILSVNLSPSITP